MLEEELSNKIIKAYYNVYNRLGYGFLEKVYENAFVLELKRMGVRGRRQVPVKVYDLGENVGEYFADIIINNRIILELKAVDILCDEHSYQLINYLKATKIEVGLLLNFGKTPQIKRKIYNNEYKKSVKIR